MKLLSMLPENVGLVAAAKSRSCGEVLEAVEAGIKIVGENYVQEAEEKYARIGKLALWHFIGHLQKNKVKKAVEIFDMLETIDSIEIAQEVDKRASQLSKIMPVLIEVNSASESRKSGVFPSEVESLARAINGLKNIKLSGLMTMGPQTGEPHELRPYFKLTKELFDKLKSSNLSNSNIFYLSMGMSDSYRIAIEEGANLVRIGTAIFGAR